MKRRETKKIPWTFSFVLVFCILLCNNVTSVARKLKQNEVSVSRGFRFCLQISPFDHFAIWNWKPFDATLLYSELIKSSCVCGMYSTEPNKRYILDDFIVMPWTFDVIVSTGKYEHEENQNVVHETCNENRCDLYHHIINLIYNNEAKTPGKFHFSSTKRQKTSWFLLNHIFEVSTRDLTRNYNDICFCCFFFFMSLKHHFSWGRNFYDSIFH